MPKKIIIINSRPVDNRLFDYLQELNNTDYIFGLYAKKTVGLEKLNTNNFKIHKLSLPDLNNRTALSFFIALSPLWYFLAIFFLLHLKLNKKIDSIIYLNLTEKILFTPLAAFLKIKNYWFEFPETNFNKLNSTIKKLYRKFSTWSKIIIFTSYTKSQLLNLGTKPELILPVSPGIKLNNFQRQENIFFKLAQNEQSQKNKKYFTIGTVANLNKEQRIESLFQAAKKCLAIIPNLQLIVVGEGNERKNLAWLAKKMEIDSFVWFVGEQTFLRKWLETLNVYVYTENNLNLNGLNSLLNAMSIGLLTIGPKDIGLEDIIAENKNGLLTEPNDSEALAQAIVMLKKNQRLCDNLSKNCRQMMNNNFSIEKSARQLENILE
jgi:glycosyltransferase involved in cell wall biosynthesis